VRKGPQPTLGYPTRTQAVVALARAGHCDRAIADRLGIPAKNVAALRASAERQARIRLASAIERNTLPLPRELLERLRPYAERRGVSPAEIIVRLLDAALDDHIVDAILDDAAVLPERRYG